MTIDKKCKKIEEGEGAISTSAVGASANDAKISSNPITADSVLGKFDKRKGCMGDGDFHLPHVFSLQRRWPAYYSKDKKKKNNKSIEKAIIAYDNLTEDEKTDLKPTLVFNIPHDKVESIIDSSKIDNKRFNKSQFSKYISPYSGNAIEFVGLFGKFPAGCLAMAALEFDKFDEDCYIAEIQAFKKGFGREMMLKLLKYQDKLWLLANPDADDSLLDFYRKPEFNLNEYILGDSCWGYKDAHFFYTNAIDKDRFSQFIESTYKGQNPGPTLSLGESTDSKVKIWVDDVRPTPPGYMRIESVNDFISWVDKNGADKIEVLDLDHDAGEFQKDGGDYIKILDYLEFIGTSNLNVRIHSDNPVGRQNMQRIIEKNNWNEVYDIYENCKFISERFEWFTPAGNYKTDGAFKFKCKFPPLDAKTAKKLTGLDMLEFNGDLNGVKSCIGCREGGRSYAVIEKNGIRIPFYVSSGDGGKDSVPTGHWYPFFGKGEDGWLNKGSPDDILNYYGSKQLKAIAQTLDKKLNMNTLKKFDKDHGTYLEGFPYCIASCSNLSDVYNRDLNPVCLGNKRYKENINDFLMSIGDFPLYESKNKITNNAKTIVQKTPSFKVTTVDKADKIKRITTIPKDQKEPKSIPQKLSRSNIKHSPIVNQLRSKESRMQSKHTYHAGKIKSFEKPKLKVKTISFPKKEINDKVKKQQILITTRVDAEYDKYQIGDIVRSPWKDVYKVVGRKNIDDVIYHPYFTELTDEQVKTLRKYDKIAVLTLAKAMQLKESNYEVMNSDSPNKDELLKIIELNKKILQLIPEQYANSIILEIHSYDELRILVPEGNTQLFNSKNEWYLVATLSKKMCDAAKAKAFKAGKPTKLDDLKANALMKQASLIFSKLQEYNLSFKSADYDDFSNILRPSYKDQGSYNLTTVRTFGPTSQIFIFCINQPNF